MHIDWHGCTLVTTYKSSSNSRIGNHKNLSQSHSIKIVNNNNGNNIKAEMAIGRW